MDDPVMRVLKLLQEGTISAQEAEMLISAMRGEAQAPPPEPPTPPDPPKPEESKRPFGGFDIKTPNFEHLGDRISQAISKIQPDKIARKVQAQVRAATRAGAHWGASFSSHVRVWTEGADVRPENRAEWPAHSEDTTQEFHLEPDASVLIENALGNVTVTVVESGPSLLKIHKSVWRPNSDDLVKAMEEISVGINGTDTRLDVKIHAADHFHDGTADIEAQIPRSANLRVQTHFGEVKIEGLTGRTEAVTSSGKLSMSQLGGDARGETAAGDIHISHILGTATVASQSGDIVAEDIGRGLSANTASGDVRATRVEGGRVECKSVSGDAEAILVGLNAPLDIVVESVSGDARLREAAGNIAIKAVSGDVAAEELSATRLQAQTVSGDVSLRLREAFSGAMQVNTVSGDVSVALPIESNVRVSMGTTSGDLLCDHEAQSVSASDTFWTGQIGTGAGTLTVQTISGDTRITRA